MLVVPHLGNLKRRVEFLIIVMSANSGSFAHLGLLKIDGAAKEQNGDVRPRSRINDTDSAYVKMAKIGGHASKCFLYTYVTLLANIAVTSSVVTSRLPSMSCLGLSQTEEQM